jgi:flagellar hook-associated protein 2
MGRIQSSIGLITGTDIAGTVDQLIAISGQPRDRLLSRTETLQREQTALAELTASVIGVQLAGKQLANTSTFRSRRVESSDSAVLSGTAGSKATPGSYAVRTLSTAATHSIGSLKSFTATDQALGYSGTIRVNPGGGTIDKSAALSELNGGRGVEGGVIRVTDRSGASTDIDLSSAQTIDDVITSINDAAIGVRASTSGNSLVLTDQTGSTASNLIVEQLGSEETAADLGIWGVDVASSSAVGNALELASGVSVLRGASLSELNGGSGVGPLGSLDVTLSDGSTAAIDLSAATTTSEVIDAIDASGLSLIVKVNDAGNGFQLRDVSGGSGTFSATSVDSTAADLGINTSTIGDFIVGSNLNLQTVTNDTLLADLNQGQGVTSGSFTVTDSNGNIGAVNLTVQNITTAGDLIDAINDLGIGVSASLNDAGDGIVVVDTGGGAQTLQIEDSGSGTAAADLGIAGTATNTTVAGQSVSALVGTQAGVITIEATDTLETLVTKLNDSARYGEAAIQTNEDGTYSFSVRSSVGGSDGRIAINTTGLDLDLRTNSQGRDATIALSIDGGVERFLSSSDGVFDIDSNPAGSNAITALTPLSEVASGLDQGSFTITDSAGVKSAINVAVEGISTVGELIDAIDSLGIGVDAKINDDGSGIAIVDTVGGSNTLTIEDVGNGKFAANLGIAGQASTQTVAGLSVSALLGTGQSSDLSEESSGLVLTLKDISDSPITITVEEDPDNAVSAVKSFADQFNLLIEKLDSLTFYDEATEEVGLLFGSSEALRIRSSYNRLLTGSISSAGSLKSIGQVGLQFNEDGKLDFNADELTEALKDGQLDVEAFFASDSSGLSDRLDRLAETIAGESSSMLINRSNTLSGQVEFNTSRIEGMNARLDAERERLLLQFYRMEEAIAKIQTNQAAINQIQPITL